MAASYSTIMAKRFQWSGQTERSIAQDYYAAMSTAMEK